MQGEDAVRFGDVSLPVLRGRPDIPAVLRGAAAEASGAVGVYAGGETMWTDLPSHRHTPTMMIDLPSHRHTPRQFLQQCALAQPDVHCSAAPFRSTPLCTRSKGSGLS